MSGPKKQRNERGGREGRESLRWPVVYFHWLVDRCAKPAIKDDTYKV